MYIERDMKPALWNCRCMLTLLQRRTTMRKPLAHDEFWVQNSRIVWMQRLCDLHGLGHTPVKMNIELHWRRKPTLIDRMAHVGWRNCL